MISWLHRELQHVIGEVLYPPPERVIAHELSRTDQKALCKTSRRLRDAIEPVFWASATFVLDHSQTEGTRLQLRAVARGTAVWAKGRRLRITCLAPAQQAYESVKILLRPALESFKRLRTGHWTIRGDDPDWAQRIPIDVMNAHEHLPELYLVNALSDGKSFKALAPISRLRVLGVASTPDYWPGIWPSELLGWIGQIALLSYLASYSGLERLQIDKVARDQHGKMLYECVIPKHTASLVGFRCSAFSQAPCSLLGLHTIALVSQLRRLETLQMSVPGGEVGFIIKLFLKTAAGMLSLRDIAIWPAVGSEVAEVQWQTEIAMEEFRRASDPRPSQVA
ncbi:hypothetical protein DFH09DRAFT_1071263 [Mycena vulgaris]|nr:hypothetical protein DFH09DRAFT_1071263 [Mycena vulgaris]